jgi:hypothetical protein
MHHRFERFAPVAGARLRRNAGVLIALEQAR